VNGRQQISQSVTKRWDGTLGVDGDFEGLAAEGARDGFGDFHGYESLPVAAAFTINTGACQELQLALGHAIARRLILARIWNARARR
jgi:hypothetical protein